LVEGLKKTKNRLKKKPFFETNNYLIRGTTQIAPKCPSGSNKPYALTQQSRGASTYFRVGTPGSEVIGFEDPLADSHHPSTLCKAGYSTVFVTAFIILKI
jgi:hypothetical protein